MSFLPFTHTSPELLPKDIVCAKETRDLVIECCVGEQKSNRLIAVSFLISIRLEFIHLISSEANDICEKESKKTIAPEHIISALKARHPQLPSFPIAYMSPTGIRIRTVHSRGRGCP